MTERAKKAVEISVGAIIQIVLILVTVVSLFKTLEAKANTNTRDITVHTAMDEKQWDKAFSQIDKNANDIHQLELQNTRIESNQKEILRRLDENRASNEKAYSDMMNFMQNFEVNEQ